MEGTPLTASKKHKNCPLLACIARFLAAPTEFVIKITYKKIVLKPVQFSLFS